VLQKQRTYTPELLNAINDLYVELWERSLESRESEIQVQLDYGFVLPDPDLLLALADVLAELRDNDVGGPACCGPHNYGDLTCISAGAGTGMFETLLKEVMLDRHALKIQMYPFDLHKDPMQTEWMKTAAARICKPLPVIRLDAVAAIKVYNKMNCLCLLWPPAEEHDRELESEMAGEALRSFEGEYLIYAGEYGCGLTGSVDFMEGLIMGWKEIHSFDLKPQLGHARKPFIFKIYQRAHTARCQKSEAEVDREERELQEHEQIWADHVLDELSPALKEGLRAAHARRRRSEKAAARTEARAARKDHSKDSKGRR
jgi:hypothetical protein